MSDLVRDSLVQVYLLVFSCSAVMLLTSKKPRTRSIGCFVGFCGQPLWLTTAYRHGQWGIALMSFWYAAMYVRGFFANRSLIPARDDWSVLDSPQA